jgi:hypothetical protein
VKQLKTKNKGPGRPRKNKVVNNNNNNTTSSGHGEEEEYLDV